MSKDTAIPTLTKEMAIDILKQTISNLESPEYRKRIEEAHSFIGNEMLKMMMFMFPMVMQVQLEVLKEYGYPDGHEGIVMFVKALRELEKDHAEIARLHSHIKTNYLPPVDVLATNESSAEEKQ